MKLKKCFICLVLVIMCVFGFSLFSVKTNAITSVPTNQYLGNVEVPHPYVDYNGNNMPFNATIDYGITSIQNSNYYIGYVPVNNYSYNYIYYLYDFNNNLVDDYFYTNMIITSGWDVSSPFSLAMYGMIYFYSDRVSYYIDLFVNEDDVSILFGYSLPSEYIVGDVSFVSYNLLDSIEFVEDSTCITFFDKDTGYIYTVTDSIELQFDIVEVYGDLDLFTDFVDSFYVGSSVFGYSFVIDSPFTSSLINSLISWSSTFSKIYFDSLDSYSLCCQFNGLWLVFTYYENQFQYISLGSVYMDNSYYGPDFFSTLSYYFFKSILNYEIVGTTSEQLKEQEIYYNQVIKDVEEEFYNKGFQEGNSEGFGTGYDYGYNIGYGNGIQEGSDGEFSLRSLLGTIFMFPLSVLTTGLNVELWGINVGNVLMFIFFIALGYILIKLLLKFFGR